MTRLPDASYALFKKKDGWFFLRSSEQRKEKYRRGPFDDKEVARYMAWKDAWENGVVKKPVLH